MLDNKPNQPSKFNTKNWAEINDDSHREYGIGSQIRFKTLMLKSILCDYSVACILLSGRIKITREPENSANADKRTDERIKK